MLKKLSGDIEAVGVEVIGEYGNMLHSGVPRSRARDCSEAMP